MPFTPSLPSDPVSVLKAFATEALGRVATAAVDEAMGVVEEKAEAFLGGVRGARAKVKKRGAQAKPRKAERLERDAEVIDVEAEVVTSKKSAAPKRGR